MGIMVLAQRNGDLPRTVGDFPSSRANGDQRHSSISWVFLLTSRNPSQTLTMRRCRFSASRAGLRSLDHCSQTSIPTPTGGALDRMYNCESTIILKEICWARLAECAREKRDVSSSTA